MLSSHVNLALIKNLDEDIDSSPEYDIHPERLHREYQALKQVLQHHHHKIGKEEKRLVDKKIKQLAQEYQLWDRHYKMLSSHKKILTKAKKAVPKRVGSSVHIMSIERKLEQWHTELRSGPLESEEAEELKGVLENVHSVIARDTTEALHKTEYEVKHGISNAEHIAKHVGKEAEKLGKGIEKEAGHLEKEAKHEFHNLKQDAKRLEKGLKASANLDEPADLSHIYY